MFFSVSYNLLCNYRLFNTHTTHTQHTPYDFYYFQLNRSLQSQMSDRSISPSHTVFKAKSSIDATGQLSVSFSLYLTYHNYLSPEKAKWLYTQSSCHLSIHSKGRHPVKGQVQCFSMQVVINKCFLQLTNNDNLTNKLVPKPKSWNKFWCRFVLSLSRKTHL